MKIDVNAQTRRAVLLVMLTNLLMQVEKTVPGRMTTVAAQALLLLAEQPPSTEDGPS